MPQLSAGKKALRTSARRRAINDAWRKKIKTSVKTARETLSEKDTKKAAEQLSKAESMLDRAAKRNIIHPNKAARKKSRLRKALAALTA